MKKLALVLALASTSAFAAPNPSTPNFDFLAISAGQTEHDVDNSNFIEFSASKTIQDNFYLTASFSENSFDKSDSESLSKYGATIGVFHQAARMNALYGEVGFNNLEQEDILLDDFVPLVKIGYRAALSKKMHLDLNTQYNFNKDFSDHYEVEAGLDYMMTPFLSAGLKVKHSDTTDTVELAETSENGLSGTTFAATIKYHF